jgi:hypothetical protein
MLAFDASGLSEGVAGVLEPGLSAHGWAWLAGPVLGVADDATNGDILNAPPAVPTRSQAPAWPA